MTEILDVLQRYHQLSFADRIAFYAALTNNISIEKDSLQELQTDIRFKESEQCLHCGSSHFVKNGHRKDGTQRYLCRECGRSFLIRTNSIVSGTHKSLHVWMRYFDCMMEKKTLRESAEACGISMGTSFLWRHRILDAIRGLAGKVCLDGIVEADETFFNRSYKGNHRKGGFMLPREAHKRGGDVHTKGLSDEKVCVLCAVNETGIPISRVGKLGKVSSECVEKAFAGRISPDSLLCTDNEKAYIRFAEGAGLPLIQMDTGRRICGDYNIQRVNAYHSRLKRFADHFHGVSTKYLDNYLTWHDLMFCSRKGKQDTRRLLFGYALSADLHIRSRDLPRRGSLPVLV